MYIYLHKHRSDRTQPPLGTVSHQHHFHELLVVLQDLFNLKDSWEVCLVLTIFLQGKNGCYPLKLFVCLKHLGKYLFIK